MATKYSIWITICVLAATTEVFSRPRAARQASNFMVISNYSAPCETFSATLPRVALTDQDKIELFNSLGGNIIPTLMAIDKQEAEQHFSNMMPLPQDVRVGLESFTNDKIKAALKQTISEYLHQEHPQNLDQHPPHDAAPEPEDPTTNSRRHLRLQKIPKGLLKNIKDSQGRHARDVEENVDIQNDEEIEAIKEDTVRTDADSAPDSEHAVHEPRLVPVEDTPISPVQKSSIGTSYLTYCSTRKSSVPPEYQYLTMCSACSATTELGEDMFPRIINEVTCVQGDDNCLFTEGVVHGKCQQVRMPLNGLRKREGSCVLALKDGDSVVADEWVVETLTIRVGCECTVDRYSFFADFL